MQSRAKTRYLYSMFIIMAAKLTEFIPGVESMLLQTKKQSAAETSNLIKNIAKSFISPKEVI